VEKMKKAKIKAIQGEEWKIEEELVLKEGKIYIPRNEELRMEIIWSHHNVLVVDYERK